jgi:ABC-2 type transport system ATP-binding protein
MGFMDRQGNGDLIALSGVSKSFKEPGKNPFKKRPIKKALVGVDLTIPRNRVTCLLGPNGAGKTTLIKILASLVTADAGQISYDGVLRERWDRVIQGKIGLVTPNERSFYWRLTGRQNLRFFGSLYSIRGAALDSRVAESLAETDLVEAADKPYRLYSTGMKQRLNIARALVGNPELYLLDEPASHLDPLAREDFWNFIGQTLIGKRGATVLLCTHDLEEASHLADHVAVLDQGRIVAGGSPEELQALMSGHAQLELRHEGKAPAAWLAAHRPSLVTEGPGLLRLALDPSSPGQPELIRGFVEAGGRLLEARRVQDDLLALLNAKARHDV